MHEEEERIKWPPPQPDPEREPSHPGAEPDQAEQEDEHGTDT
jgi:hypothetical protein